jgi:hypothetical protein
MFGKNNHANVMFTKENLKEMFYQDEKTDKNYKKKIKTVDTFIDDLFESKNRCISHCLDDDRGKLSRDEFKEHIAIVQRKMKFQR